MPTFNMNSRYNWQSNAETSVIKTRSGRTESRNDGQEGIEVVEVCTVGKNSGMSVTLNSFNPGWVRAVAVQVSKKKRTFNYSKSCKCEIKNILKMVHHLTKKQNSTLD